MLWMWICLSPRCLIQKTHSYITGLRRFVSLSFSGKNKYINHQPPTQDNMSFLSLSLSLQTDGSLESSPPFYPFWDLFSNFRVQTMKWEGGFETVRDTQLMTTIPGEERMRVDSTWWSDWSKRNKTGRNERYRKRVKMGKSSVGRLSCWWCP